MTLPTTDPADVVAITGTSMATATIELIIESAELMAAGCLSGLSEETQAAALLWLSCHLVSTTPGNQTLTSRKLGDASKTFATGTLGGGISSSLYGQNAVALVPCLAGLGKGRASMEVI